MMHSSMDTFRKCLYTEDVYISLLFFFLYVSQRVYLLCYACWVVICIDVVLYFLLVFIDVSYWRKIVVWVNCVESLHGRLPVVDRIRWIDGEQ